MERLCPMIESMSLPTPPPTNDTQVKLQVGNEEFITSRDTLQESGFFKCLLSRWEHNASPDGSFFIDGDGDLFEHILRYLRRGILPVFYTKEKGHDYAMYGAMLQEAKYYQIDRLRKWLETKRYLDVVKMQITTTVHGWNKNFPSQPVVEDCASADAEIQQSYHWTTRKRFKCPIQTCDVPCSRTCQSLFGDRMIKVHKEEEVEVFQELKIIEVKKEVIFDHEVCLIDSDELSDEFNG